MKVILDIGSVRYPLTGIGRYTYELAQHLSAMDDLDDLIFWNTLNRAHQIPTPDQFSKEIPQDTVAQNPNQIKSTIRIKQRLKDIAKKNYSIVNFYQAIQQRLAEIKLSKYHDYVFHGPNFYLPRLKGCSVVTIHDLSFIDIESTHPAVRVQIMKNALQQAKKNADYIITISDYSKKRICEHLDWPNDKIMVTYMAASDIFFPRTEDTLHTFLTAYNLVYQSYSLFVGTIEPRKNINILLEAYDKLPKSLRRRFPLVVCGYKGWKNDDLFLRMMNAEEQGWLRHIDFLPHEHLPLLMAGARLFLFPSLYEGFGIPPLEAMQSGVPVIVSHCTSLPEVVGHAAPLLDPQDALAWKEGIEKGLEDNQWQEESIQLGLEQSRKFSWQRCADETLLAYRNALQMR